MQGTLVGQVAMPQSSGTHQCAMHIVSTKSGSHTFVTSQPTFAIDEFTLLNNKESKPQAHSTQNAQPWQYFYSGFL
jgi:hypothetical protein